MAVDPFATVLGALEQVDVDLNYRTNLILTLMTAFPTQVTQALIKAKTDNLDIPLSTLSAALGGTGAVYDTGYVALLAAGATPRGTTVNGLHLFAINISAGTAYLTVQDGDLNYYYKDFEMVAGAVLHTRLDGLSFHNGLKWKADIDSALCAQFKGQEP